MAFEDEIDDLKFVKPDKWTGYAILKSGRKVKIGGGVSIGRMSGEYGDASLGGIYEICNEEEKNEIEKLCSLEKYYNDINRVIEGLYNKTR